MNSLGQKSAIQIGLAHFRAFALTISIIGLVVIAFVAMGWQSFDDKIKQHCEIELNKSLEPVGLIAKIDSARFVDGTGIEIQQLELFEAEKDSDQPIASAKKIVLSSRCSLASLVAGEFKPDQVHVYKAHVRATRDSNGHWDWQSLIAEILKNQKHDFELIPIEFEEGSIRLSTTDPQRRTIQLSKINGKLWPQSSADGATNRYFNARLSARTESHGQLAMSGVLDPRSKVWKANCQASGLVLDRNQLEVLIPQNLKQIERIDSIRFATSFRGTANGRGFQQPPKFKIDGSIRGGSIKDRQLPESISNVQLEYQITDAGLFLYQGSATTGLGKAEFNYKQSGLFERKNWQLFGKLERVTLHRGLRKLLPPKMQKEWDQFSPAGTIDLQYHFWQNENAMIRKQLKAKLINASFEHQEIPFRFNSCVGEVVVDDRKCVVDIQALEQNQIISITGLLHHPGPRATGYIDIQINERLPISEKVLSSIKRFPNISNLIADFKPSGHFSLTGKMHRNDPGKPFQLDYEVSLHDCSVRYKHFDFPFYKVNGVIKVVDFHTTFQNLTALNGNGSIRCNGTYDWRTGLELRFVATQVALDEQLRLALPEDMQQTWQEIHPKGTVNQVTVDLTNPPKGNNVKIVVDAKAFGQQGRPSQVSIRPSWFPYDIENLAGHFHWDDGQLTMRNVSGKHGRGWFHCNGDGVFGETDWKLTLSDLVSGAIRVDQQLLMALPQSIQTAVEQVEFNGIIGVSGKMEFSGKTVVESMATRQPTQTGIAPVSAVSVTSDTTRMRWNLQIDTDNAKMYLGMPIEKIGGSVKLMGAYNDSNYYCIGSLHIDSALCNQIYVSNLQGPLWIDRERISFGNRAQWRGQPGPPRSLQGSLFEGQLNLDGEVRFENNYPFVVMATLNEGNLKAAMGELTTGGKNFSGRGFASVTVYGNSSGTHSLRGQGKIRLRDALIEIPLMEKLGEVLPRQLDSATLDAGNVDFTIHGEDFDLNRIELIGNKISLIGKGKVNIEKEADINFYTVVGRNRIDIPVITDLLKMGSQQILVIRVDGNLNDPKIEKEIPAVTDSLRLILQDLELLQGNGERLRQRR